MKQFADSDVNIRVEMFQKGEATWVRIYNDEYSGKDGMAFIELHFIQFQRLMAVGELLCHPRF